MVDTVTEAIQKLNVRTSEAMDSEDVADIVETLNRIIDAFTAEGNDKKVLAEQLSTNSAAQALTILLQMNESGMVEEKAAEVVAELAKTDTGRKHCSHVELISALLQLLSCPVNVDASVQVCRALGNICFDNDYGKSIVHEKGGEEVLVKFLQSDVVTSQENEQLRTVATGFLFNLINTYGITQDHMLEMDILGILCNRLSKYGQEDDACIYILMILNCLADNCNGRKKMIEKNICSVLVSLMEMEDITSEVLEAILELTRNLAEDDVVKYQLATTNLCQKLIKLIKPGQESQYEDSINVTKVGCDFIVLLLTGDESMEYLYGDGQGVVYKEITKWLSSSDDTMQTAAVLGIGNFARKGVRAAQLFDEHCIRMVSEGITTKLLDLLNQHNTKDGNIKLQHAILSALRNLAIPSVNKGALIESGVVESLLPMTSVQTFPVVFKLLGTLRMLVDGQEETARNVGVHRDCVARVVTWCSTEEHPGIKGEANRLQAWLIKNSKCVDVMKCIVELGGLPFLVSMITSEHEVMQNEALIALSLVCAGMLDSVDLDLVKHEMSSKLQRLLSDDGVQSEVKCNALSLIQVAAKSDKVKEDFRTAEIPQEVEKLARDAEQNAKLCVAAKSVEQLFESG